VPGRLPITLALFVATCLVALDTSVIATALPTVIGQIGGVHLYAWAFSAYLLTSTVSVPIYGKLADLYGRKPIFLVSASVFLVGSALCGQSQSMEQLIAFRLLQGIGAGGVLPMTTTILGDVYPLEERARMTGLFSAAWGVSGLLGPAIGGFLTEQVSWRWVFYVNLPLCVLAIALIWWFLHEQVQHRSHSIDVLGALTLTGAASSLLLALQSSDNPALQAVLYAMAALLVPLFIWHERRAPEPILPLNLLRQRIIGISTLAALLMGTMMYGQTTFMPPLVQGVMGATPTVSGFVLAGMSVAWSASTPIAGRLLVRVGFRLPCVIGGLLLTLGFILLTQLTVDANLWMPFVFACFIGSGFGFVSVTTLLAAQSAVGWDQRGVVTSANQFARNMGGTLGVPIAGVFFAGYITAAASAGFNANDLLSPELRASLAGPELAFLRGSLTDSLHLIFVLFAVLAVLATLVAAFLPSGRPQPSST